MFGEIPQYFICGQRYRLSLLIDHLEGIEILNIKWNLNDNLTKICEYPPFSQILNEQYKKLGIISDETNNSNLFKNDVYVEILPEIIGEDSKQSSIGEVIVEWRSQNSLEPIRSLISIKQLPFYSSQISLQINLINENNNNSVDNYPFQVGYPFKICFTLWNSLGKTTEEGGGEPLPIQIFFEQNNNQFIFSGIKEGFFTLLPDGTKFNFIQQIIPISPGFIKFPQPQIKLIENNSKNYDLDVVNRQISIYMGSCLPKEIFVLP
uniref:Uncharacterized protein n=1 Tax=Meloidogyne enterolobii TaxID=390850 RepID=A0A6V7TT46_MELEN|nr:unnamed protein product [Meloidogyne enterolobii]